VISTWSNLEYLSVVAELESTIPCAHFNELLKGCPKLKTFHLTKKLTFVHQGEYIPSTGPLVTHTNLTNLLFDMDVYNEIPYCELPNLSAFKLQCDANRTNLKHVLHMLGHSSQLTYFDLWYLVFKTEELVQLSSLFPHLSFLCVFGNADLSLKRIFQLFPDLKSLRYETGQQLKLPKYKHITLYKCTTRFTY